MRPKVRDKRMDESNRSVKRTLGGSWGDGKIVLITLGISMEERMTDWREDGQAAQEYEQLMREREEWLSDEEAQAEYLEYLKEVHREVD